MRRTFRRSLLCAVVTALSGHAAHSATLPRFPAGSVWNQDISGANAAVHSNSAGMISTLQSLGGWGNGNTFHIDFGMRVVQAAAGAPTKPIIVLPSIDPNDQYYSPDCEAVGTQVPVPANAMIEGSADTTCDNFNGDCHLLVVQGNNLFEVYRANVTAQGIEAQCLAQWDLSINYPAQGRGEHCTSADAAGFPISALLFNADEVAAGHIDHAIRFILPNARMATDASLGGSAGKLYVHPGTHAGNPTGPSGTVPYGVRLRLKASFDVSPYSASAQVVLNAMKKYGIVLADGGNIALTAEDDVYTTAKWATLGIDSHSLYGVQVTDFEVIDTGPRIGEDYNCVRTSFPADVLFKDDFE